MARHADARPSIDERVRPTDPHILRAAETGFVPMQASERSGLMRNPLLQGVSRARGRSEKLPPYQERKNSPKDDRRRTFFPLRLECLQPIG